MSNQPLVTSLKTILADSVLLYLKTQNYHWNVEGPQFKSIHDLLELQYTDLAGAIDHIAELIRVYGEKAPGTFAAYKAISTIPDGDEHANASTMLTHLLEDQERIVKNLHIGIQAAHDANDDAASDALTQRVAVHQKNHWMLASMLK